LTRPTSGAISLSAPSWYYPETNTSNWEPVRIIKGRVSVYKVGAISGFRSDSGGAPRSREKKETKP